LGRRLLEKGEEFRIAIFGSPSERDLTDRIAGGLGAFPSRVTLVVQPDVLTAAAAYRSCSCVVTGCSGSAHLAAAVGTTVVGLYGPTNPGFTGPYVQKKRIVRLGLRCSPCYRVGFIEGCGNPLCMLMLDVDRVEKEVLLALDGQFLRDLPWCATTNATRADLRIRGHDP
jgi:ADP-heptose:LPS heptosyltransferase